MYKVILCSTLSLLLLAACGPTTPRKHQTTRCFYYWKNDSPSTKELKIMQNLRNTRIYAKYLDIDWNPVNGAFPVSMNDLYWVNYLDSTISDAVPCIFITNRTLEKCSEQDVNTLAQKITDKLNQDFKNLQFNPRYNEAGDSTKPVALQEIQLDCDWTGSTKTKYFQLLKILKKNTQKTISTTLRLWQYKNRDKAGIPPADRVMLMCYNLQSVRKYEVRNSIFEKSVATPYFKTSTSYPLPMDAAIPAWSWGLAFRNRNFLTIFENMHPNMANTATFLKKEKDNYRVLKDTVYQNVYLRNGDEIRIETCSPQDMLDAASLASGAIANKATNVAIFDLDFQTLQYFKHENLEKAYRLFE